MYRLQETIVYTIGELGKEARDDLLLVVIISLLETLLTGRKLTSSIAFTQVRTPDFVYWLYVTLFLMYLRIWKWKVCIT